MVNFTKIIAIIMSFFYMLIGGNPDKVMLEFVTQPTAESEYIEIEIQNYSGKTVTTDKSVKLEKEVDGTWVEVPAVCGFEEIAVQIRNCKTFSLKINIVDMYGHKLESGKYRISKDGISTILEFEI